MNDIMSSVKIYFSYNKSSRYKFYIIPAILLSIPGIFLAGGDYTESMSFLYIGLILILACSFTNDVELKINERFIKTTVVSKNIYTLVPIIINNILGVGYIVLISLIKYILIKHAGKNMESLIDTIFILLFTVGAISCIKILLSRFHVLNFFLVMIVILIIEGGKYTFELLDIIKKLFNNNSMYVLMTGIVLWLILNALAYFCSRYIR